MRRASSDEKPIGPPHSSLIHVRKNQLQVLFLNRWFRYSFLIKIVLEKFSITVGCCRHYFSTHSALAYSFHLRFDPVVSFFFQFISKFFWPRFHDSSFV